MSSFRNNQSISDNENINRLSEVPSGFKRRHVNDWRCLFPRRYVLAGMLFLLPTIQAWRNINVAFTLAHILILGEEGAKSKYSSIGHWSVTELDNYKAVTLVIGVFVQMPGALLIFIFSSHKFLLLTVLASSLMHMLTPVALNHHSISLLFVLLTESAFTAPMNIAIITIWKDWASPAERTKLVVLSFYGIFIGAAVSTFYTYVFSYVTTDASFYLAGMAGIIWALFWFNIISDTPQNDPLISEEELLYIENNIPNDHLQKIKVKDIPWKSIITSKPVLVLCLVFSKFNCSITSIVLGGTVFSFHLAHLYNPLYFFIPFASFFIIFIPLIGVLADWLIKTFGRKTLLIRKAFLCGGILLQCLFMFGTMASSLYTKTIFFMISYCFFALSVPGFITIPLDLSPRYVSIIAGICFTFYELGLGCLTYFVDATISFLHLDSFIWLFFFDGCLSLLSAIFFGRWGDTEEQLWSLTSPTFPKTNDYRSYPKPEDEDDLNLVP